MNGFKEFFTEATEEEKNVRTTLKKLPKNHRDLIKGYKFHWERGCCLKGDNNHIGIINPKTKIITIAAPYNYGREYTVLHEIAHKVWEKLPLELKKKWLIVVKENPHRDKSQNEEENFAMSYADFYAKNKLVKHNCPAWVNFIKNLPVEL
jgi:hypothetical protein